MVSDRDDALRKIGGIQEVRDYHDKLIKELKNATRLNEENERAQFDKLKAEFENN